MESKYITGTKNVDYLIYNKLDDLSLYNLCLSSRTKSEICKDEGYFKYRIQTYYSKDIVNLKPNNITYKQQYICSRDSHFAKHALIALASSRRKKNLAFRA